jgi:hypothetical protein
MSYRIIRTIWPMGLPLLGLLILLALLFGFSGAPQRATAGGTPATAEAWRLGISSEGNAAYTALIGRSAESIASFRSNRGVQDIYFIFPATAQTRTIQSVMLNIVSRTGSYANVANLTFEIRSADGTLQHTVSASPLNLQAATTANWLTIALSANAANLTLAPGEHLVAHFNLTDVPGGDLDVRPLFEVVVQ